jgi:hypothetical protein
MEIARKTQRALLGLEDYGAGDGGSSLREDGQSTLDKLSDFCGWPT